ISDFDDRDSEFALLEAMATASGRPLSFSVIQTDDRPDQWRWLLDRAGESDRKGLRVRGQVAARAVGMMLGWDATYHPFVHVPAYRDVADLPIQERLERLRRPEVRQAILDQLPGARDPREIGSRLADKL